MTSAEWTNWAGTQRAVAAGVERPTNTEEVAAAVVAAVARGLPVKPVGSGHSFTAAAGTEGVRLETDRLDGLYGLDLSTGAVTVGAGLSLRRLNSLLARHGLALPNLGDIDAQTLAGALATGTHGTGARFGGLATFVEALTLVTAAGEVLRCSAGDRPDVFAAAVVGIGAVGVVTELTLRCVPAFPLRADERPMPLAQVLADLDEHVENNDHFEFFWFPYTGPALTKRNNRVAVSDRPLAAVRGWIDDEFLSNTVFGGVCRLGRAMPRLVPGLSRLAARALTPRVYTGPSYEIFCSPRRVRFVEMEYSLPRGALPEAFAALRGVLDGLRYPVLLPVEVRFAAADDIWLSPGYGRDSAYLAIHQYVGMPYEEYFRRFERICAALDGRPHWGKIHYRDAASLAPAYPRFSDFLAIRDRLDPDRVFGNAYTARVLGP